MPDDLTMHANSQTNGPPSGWVTALPAGIAMFLVLSAALGHASWDVAVIGVAVAALFGVRWLERRDAVSARTSVGASILCLVASGAAMVWGIRHW